MAYCCQKQKWFLELPIATILMIMFLCLPAYATKNLRDDDIRNAVEDQIDSDIVVFLEGIDTKVNKGIVTLSGKVENILVKERAGKIAKMVKGVRSVVNNIRVVPSILRTDAEILNDVNKALLSDPAADSYELTVNVKDNIVTLSGTVQSWQERMLSEQVAKGVKGVKQVANNINIEYKAKRSDLEIKSEIQRAMRWNVLLDHMLISVSVDDGKVFLNGIVGSAIEKDEAFNTALVAGVKSVDTTGLEVKKWARDKDLRGNKYVIKSDKEIKDAVEAAFLYDPRVFLFKVDVEVENGTATLRGTVDNLKTKRAASQDARNTVGVFHVKNRIKVKPAESISDEKVAERIRKALLVDPFVERYDVTVIVRNGIVDLYGLVDSHYEKAKAGDVASLTPGVIAVDNNITVSQFHRPYVYDPYLDDWYIYDYDWYFYEPRLSINTDTIIKDDIESQLFWSPFVDSDDVHVKVEDGVATLSGEVDSWSEFYAAHKNALEGGAVDVKNQLNVKKSG